MYSYEFILQQLKSLADDIDALVIKLLTGASNNSELPEGLNKQTQNMILRLAAIVEEVKKDQAFFALVKTAIEQMLRTFLLIFMQEKENDQKAKAIRAANSAKLVAEAKKVANAVNQPPLLKIKITHFAEALNGGENFENKLAELQSKIAKLQEHFAEAGKKMSEELNNVLHKIGGSLPLVDATGKPVAFELTPEQVIDLHGDPENQQMFGGIERAQTLAGITNDNDAAMQAEIERLRKLRVFVAEPAVADQQAVAAADIQAGNMNSGEILSNQEEISVEPEAGITTDMSADQQAGMAPLPTTARVSSAEERKAVKSAFETVKTRAEADSQVMVVNLLRNEIPKVLGCQKPSITQAAKAAPEVGKLLASQHVNYLKFMDDFVSLVKEIQECRQQVGQFYRQQLVVVREMQFGFEPRNDAQPEHYPSLFGKSNMTTATVDEFRMLLERIRSHSDARTSDANEQSSEKVISPTRPASKPSF